MKKTIGAEECFNLAEKLYDQAEYQKALEYYLESFRLEPMPGVAYNIAFTYKNLGNLGAAKEYFQITIDMRTQKLSSYKNTPEFEEKSNEINPKLAKAYLEMGLIHDALGNFFDALVCYDKALEIDPADGLSYSGKSAAYSKLAIAADEAGNHKKALEYYEKSLINDDLSLQYMPDNIVCLCNKAKGLNSLGRYEESLECYAKVQELVGAGGLEGLPADDVEYIQTSLASEWLKAAQDEQPATGRRPSSDHQKAEFEAMKKALAGVCKQVYDHEKILQDSGIKELADIFRGLKELEEDPTKTEIFEYANTFYWTLTAYFEAYKVLSTKLVKGDIEANQSNKEKAVQTVSVALVKKGLQLGAEVAKTIPFAGSIIALVDGVIDNVCDAINQNRFERKVDAVNAISTKHFNLNSDMERKLSKTALDMAEARADEILNPAETDNKLSWLEAKLNSIQKKVLPGVNVEQGIGAKLAVRDVAFLLTYLYANYEEVLQQKKGTISHVFSDIILKGELPENITKSMMEADVPPPIYSEFEEKQDLSPVKASKTGASKAAKLAKKDNKGNKDKDCIVMKVEIEHDNPFIGSKAYQEAVNKFDASTVYKLINFSGQFLGSAENMEVFSQICGQEDALSTLTELLGCD